MFSTQNKVCPGENSIREDTIINMSYEFNDVLDSKLDPVNVFKLAWPIKNE